MNLIKYKTKFIKSIKWIKYKWKIIEKVGKDYHILEKIFSDILTITLGGIFVCLFILLLLPSLQNNQSTPTDTLLVENINPSLTSPLSPFPNTQPGIIYSYDGKYFAIIDERGICRISNLTTGMIINEIALNDIYPEGHKKNNIHRNILFRPKTYQIIISQDQYLWIWSPFQNDIIEFPKISDQPIHTISFNFKETKLATVGIKNQVIIWNVDEIRYEEIYNVI